MKLLRQGARSARGISARSAIRCRAPKTAFQAGVILVASLLATGQLPGEVSRARTEEPLLFVVMDPLSKELACACVKGYGQRDYRKLLSRIEKATNQRVAIEFSDDLAESMAGLSSGREVIVIGEQSLVTHGAKQARWKCHPVCMLSDRDGNITHTASFLARSGDPARELKDVAGRQLFIGVSGSDELQAATFAALRTAGVEGSVSSEKRASYSDAALDILDSQLSPPPVAVIPTYALPLLEGCGSVKPGNLKVIGKTQPVPFIAVFVSDAMPADRQERILQVLLASNRDPKLLKAMESRDGFKRFGARGSSGTKSALSTEWPDWRGPDRRAHVPRRPSRLPATAKIFWKKAAMQGCLAGLSVGGGRLILAERDFAEENDVYRCLSVNDGALLWRIEFPATGKLDYGQSPRATPVIHRGTVSLLGACRG